MRPFLLTILASCAILLAAGREIADYSAIERAWARGDEPLAEQIALAQVERGERLFGPDHFVTGLLLWHYGVRQLDLHPEQALITLRRAAELLGDWGPDSLLPAEMLTVQASALDRLKRFSEAEALLLEALALREAQMGPDASLTRVTRKKLAVVWIDLDLQRAEQTLEELLVVAERRWGGARERASLLRELGGVRLRMGDVDGALGVSEQAVQLDRATRPSDHDLLRKSLLVLFQSQCRARVNSEETLRELRAWYEARGERGKRWLYGKQPCEAVRK